MAFTASGAAATHRGRVHGLLSYRNDVPATLPRQKELAPHPVGFVGAAVQRAGGQQQEEVRPLRDLREDLFRPLARIDTVDVQEDVVAMVFELLFDQAGEGIPGRVPPVTDEDRFLTHDVKTRLESSTAAQHGTEKPRVGAKTQAQRRCSRAPSSESFWEGAKGKG